MRLFGPKFGEQKQVFAAYQKLDAMLQESGFKQIQLGTIISPNIPSELIGKHEVIYNRAEGSNYFVYVKLDDYALKILYTNPDSSQTAKNLPRYDVQTLRVLDSDINADNWYAATIDDILNKSSKKPKTSFYAMLHGHYGSINSVDLQSLNIDDGKSDANLAIRNMMLYNFDIDATGHHNHFIPELAEYVRDLERQVGIVKMPGIELTFPYKNGAMNGPHMNVWFKDFATACDFSEKILLNRSGEYAPFAPAATQEDILTYFKDKIDSKSIAVGLAHFFTDCRLPGAGMGNRIAMGDWSIDSALEFASKYATAIESFNCGTPADQIVPFEKLSDQKYFKNLLKKEHLSALTPINLNHVVSKKFENDFGQWTYVGHDTHVYHELDYSDDYRRITRQGRGETIFDLKDIPSVRRGEKPTSEEIMHVMHSSDAKRLITAFAPLSVDLLGHMNVVSQRRDDKFSDKFQEQYKTWKMYAKMLPTFARDYAKNGNNVRD